MPLPVVRSRIGHLQELTVEYHLGDHVRFLCRHSLAPGALDDTVALQAHEANVLEVMHLHIMKNLPHSPLFGGREILHRPVGRAMGQDGDEITDILQLLKRAELAPALIVLPDALANLLIAHVIRHQAFSEGTL
jgi:hypothetical protein